jgi:predicted glycosyltransferase involved in capsule biosynthesis
MLRVLGLRGLGRAWLRKAVLEDLLSRPRDITVVIGVRNRADYRIANALRSIREQTYAAELVRVLVVDYGSEPSSQAAIMNLCAQYDAEYVPVDEAPVWSRARCLNIGIRRASTTFLMTSDADVMFSRRYLADAIRTLEVSPLSVLVSSMLDLPKESVEVMEDAARPGGQLSLSQWKGWCSPRFGSPIHYSIALTWTAFFHLIRGYDEYYELWGWEDYDLMRRFRYLGLRPQALDSGSFYLHQWHPKFEGVPGGENAPAIGRNLAYYRWNRSIVRNDGDWGTAQPREERRDSPRPGPERRDF